MGTPTLTKQSTKGITMVLFQIAKRNAVNELKRQVAVGNTHVAIS